MIDEWMVKSVAWDLWRYGTKVPQDRLECVKVDAGVLRKWAKKLTGLYADSDMVDFYENEKKRIVEEGDYE